jgi:hypothetical protein
METAKLGGFESAHNPVEESDAPGDSSVGFGAGGKGSNQATVVPEGIGLAGIEPVPMGVSKGLRVHQK